MALYLSKRDVIENVIGGFVLLVVAAAIVAFTWWLASFSCHQRWEDSGMDVRYKFFSGCQVKVNDKWMPAATIRNF